MKFLVLLVLLFGLGCPQGQVDAPTGECTKIAEKCRIAKGKLGVCTMGIDQQLFCAPQH